MQRSLGFQTQVPRTQQTPRTTCLQESESLPPARWSLRSFMCFCVAWVCVSSLGGGRGDTEQHKGVCVSSCSCLFPQINFRAISTFWRSLLTSDMFGKLHSLGGAGKKILGQGQVDGIPFLVVLSTTQVLKSSWEQHPTHSPFTPLCFNWLVGTQSPGRPERYQTPNFALEPWFQEESEGRHRQRGLCDAHPSLSPSWSQENSLPIRNTQHHSTGQRVRAC